MDPLSQVAQTAIPVLRYLRDHLGARVELLLNPATGHTDLPLKAYYAYALPEVPAADDTALASPPPLPSPPRAWFPRLPDRRVLTLNIAVPEAWLVEVR